MTGNVEHDTGANTPPPPGWLTRLGGLINTRIGRLIFLANLAALIVLIGGAMILNEMRAGLVKARAGSLISQGELIANLLSEGATVVGPEPGLSVEDARALMRTFTLQDSVRARLYNRNGELVADSFFLSGRIDESSLPEPGPPSLWSRTMAGLSDWFAGLSSMLRPKDASDVLRLQPFETELQTALAGETSAGQRFSDTGERIISVSQPVQRVSAVVGVVTLEASDMAEIVQAEREALIPIIGIAMLVALGSTGLLVLVIARPLRRLSLAADRVREGRSREIDLPGLTRRRDEIGALARSMETMTSALNDRIVKNERFAADVAHELKNPLTSIRSAVETSRRLKDDPDARERLRELIAKDVMRLDRLITDISNASRLEAEILREPDANVDLRQLLGDIVSSYGAIDDDRGVEITLDVDPLSPAIVRGRAGPLSQVFRNLIDNARSFSPEGGMVALRVDRSARAGETWYDIIVEDDGPGIPADKLEKVFDRFYTDRPAGAAFGDNSGLGLSIVKDIVDSHRGRVFAENRIDAAGTQLGARFVVQLRGLSG